MKNPLDFRKPDPVVSVRDVYAAIRAAPPSIGKTWADDHAMLNKAFGAFMLTDEESARFTVLRKAITEDGYLNLSLQIALLDAVVMLKAEEVSAESLAAPMTDPAPSRPSAS